MKRHFRFNFQRICAVAFITFLSLAAVAQDNSDPRAVISKDLPGFTKIHIQDMTHSSSRYRMWGYPGIWIKSVDSDVAKITYNNVCSPYITAEVTDGTLTLKMDQSFLYPDKTSWKSSYGMISAIIIEVPRKMKLESLINDGRYQFNTSIMDLDCKKLSVSMSNSLSLFNCKIKELDFHLYDAEPLSAGCTYNLSLKMTDIGTLTIPETEVPQFSLVESLGSKVNKYVSTK